MCHKVSRTLFYGYDIDEIDDRVRVGLFHTTSIFESKSPPYQRGGSQRL